LADSSLTRFSCAYPVAGAFTTRGRIADKDGGLTPYTVSITVLTPSQGAAGPIDQVRALMPGTLDSGQGNALISKLQEAIRKIDRGNVAAINQLQAFINQVNSLISDGVLTAAQGQPLIDTANDIIAALSP
jgi:hypothetical protein